MSEGTATTTSSTYECYLCSQGLEGPRTLRRHLLKQHHAVSKDKRTRYAGPFGLTAEQCRFLPNNMPEEAEVRVQRRRGPRARAGDDVRPAKRTKDALAPSLRQKGRRSVADIVADRGDPSLRPSFAASLASADNLPLVVCRNVSLSATSARRRTTPAGGGSEALTRTMPPSADATITSVSTGEEAYYSNSYANTGAFPEKLHIAARNEERYASYATTSNPSAEVTPILIGFRGPTIVKIVKHFKDHILAYHEQENPNSL